MRKKTSRFDVFLYVFMTLFSLIVFYPFYYVIINSFNAHIAKGYVMLWPQQLGLRGYIVVLQSNSLLNSFAVSALRTVLGIFTTLTCCTMAAFSLRKRNLAFRNFYLILFTIPMFFSGGLIPRYLNFRNLGLLDNFFVYVLPTAFSMFYTIILMTSFNDLPESIEEAAIIDGANSFTVLIKIFVPISIPVLATIALYAGVNQWNNWFDTLYFTKSPKLSTLSAMMMRIIIQSSAGVEINQVSGLEMKDAFELVEAIKLSTLVLSIAPIVCIYPFLQRYFITGLTLGAVKE